MQNVIKLHVRVKPNAKCNEILSVLESDGAIIVKLSVKQAPERGKANIAVINLLSDVLKIKKRDIEIIHGDTDQNKFLHIKNTNKSVLDHLMKNFLQ